MTGRREKEIGEQGEAPDSGCSVPKHAKSNDAREKSGEHQRMRESAMPPRSRRSGCRFETQSHRDRGQRSIARKPPRRAWGFQVDKSMCRCSGRQPRVKTERPSFFLRRSCSTLRFPSWPEHFYSRFPNCDSLSALCVGFAGFSWDSSKGLPPVLLQAVDPKGALSRSLVVSRGKGSNQQSGPPFLVSLSTPFRSILHRVNPNLSTVIGASRNGDVQAFEAFLAYLPSIPGRASTQGRGNFG
jgi:hypothetical protein